MTVTESNTVARFNKIRALWLYRKFTEKNKRLNNNNTRVKLSIHLLWSAELFILVRRAPGSLCIFGRCVTSEPDTHFTCEVGLTVGISGGSGGGGVYPHPLQAATNNLTNKITNSAVQLCSIQICPAFASESTISHLACMPLNPPSKSTSPLPKSWIRPAPGLGMIQYGLCVCVCHTNTTESIATSPHLHINLINL